jgi:hypothetical protein
MELNTIPGVLTKFVTHTRTQNEMTSPQPS